MAAAIHAGVSAQPSLAAKSHSGTRWDNRITARGTQAHHRGDETWVPVRRPRVEVHRGRGERTFCHMLRRSLAILLLLAAPTAAQQPALAPAAAPPATSALNVFLDCPDGGCDFDYFRTELGMVNWVRDRQVADLHILVTEQRTGGGGEEFTVTFIGLRQFTGINDTLRYVSPPAASDDAQRKGLAGVFKLGLVRYVARTPAGAKITVSFGDASATAPQTSTQKDRWKAWVFRMSLNGFINGEKSFKYLNMGGSVSADRITERWKTRFSARESYTETHSTFPICDALDVCKDTTYKYFQRNYNGSVLQVKGLGQHWSAGLRGNIQSSTYQNYRRVVRVAPAVEYNVFPYSQSTRRQLRIEYNVGYTDFAYRDTTVFDKIREGMPNQQLQVNMATREPWGSIDLGISGTSYLNDRTKYRLGSFGELELRIFKGLSLNIDGGYEVIRDQFALAKKSFTPEEILTRQFQQSTTYFYFGSVGFSYTFGSIFNNVVNPRMSD